ncbi:MAG: NUDIX domain-containing protein [Bacteroidota bacterium]
MKIFALNLSLEFEVRDPKGKFTFETISFAELMGHLFKGTGFEGQKYYIDGLEGEDFIQEIFELQANEIWREMDITICVIFPTEKIRQTFWETFQDRFKHVDAAGGLVVNEHGEYLCILNRGRWTLPKGVVEWREPVEEAAVREVMEETGIEAVQLLHEIEPSFHTFRRRRKWVLKTTYWYRMQGSSQSSLTPQVDEQIEEVAWKSKNEWLELAPRSYPLIRNLFEAEFAKSII